MDLYDKVCLEMSQKLTQSYSSSFAMSSRLYSPGMRPHIFNIYGWVRVGGEIANTYRGHNASKLLEQFKQDTYQALKDGYSSNPIIHAFAFTAHAFGIGKDLIDPFLGSVAMDVHPPKKYTAALYKAYVNGAGQSVSLMTLKVFTANDEEAYASLQAGAEALGAAFQKINFLRDFAHDTKVLGRSYFPYAKNKHLSEQVKKRITNEIRHDLTHALPTLGQLPKEARTAVMVTARYYYELLNRLESATAETIANQHIGVPEWRKAQIFASVKASNSFRRSPVV